MKVISICIISIFFLQQTAGQCLGSEKLYKDYYKKNISNLDPIEGIWSASTTFKIYNN